MHPATPDAELPLSPNLSANEPQPLNHTSNGLSLDIIELDGDEAKSRRGCQTHMESRADLYTHPRSLALANMQLSSWRLNNRIRTAGMVMAVCVDLHSNKHYSGHGKHAILEAWTDLSQVTSIPDKAAALEHSLVKQFAQQFSADICTKPLIDCDEFRLERHCLEARIKAHNQRVMFYYNGHGTPGLYIWDCSQAAAIVQGFKHIADQRNREISRIRSIIRAANIAIPSEKLNDEQDVSMFSRVAALLAAQPRSSANGHLSTGASLPANPELIKLALQPSVCHEDIHFAACQPTQVLPTNPELPADLFTACLTTPVKAAVRCWVHRNPHASKVTVDICDRIPGTLHERNTPLGELNWIITAICDTIAWCTLPRDLFCKLFRQDAVVATLYRNYLLADRIMRHYGVQPLCSPSIPTTHKHPLWESLDYEIDVCLQQLPRLLEEAEWNKQRENKMRRDEEERRLRANRRQKHNDGSSNSDITSVLENINPLKLSGTPKIRLEIAKSFSTWKSHDRSNMGAYSKPDVSDSDSSSDSDGANDANICQRNLGYITSMFFVNQLNAFDVWLQHRAVAISEYMLAKNPADFPLSLSTNVPDFLEQPQQLPVVLQLLLSQKFRLGALMLLYRFVSLGPWAVDLALHVGFFPYMMRLLASRTVEVQELVILIWARLIAVDPSLGNDLLKNNGIDSFIAYLSKNAQVKPLEVDDKSRLSDSIVAAAAFVLAMTCRCNSEAPKAMQEKYLLHNLLAYLAQPDSGTCEKAVSQVWIIMCLAQLWRSNCTIKGQAITFASWVAQNMEQHPSLSPKKNNFQKLYMELVSDGSSTSSLAVFDAQDLLIQMAFHRVPSVRTAAIYAMGTLVAELSQLGDGPGVLTIVQKTERQIYALLLQASADGSPMVRCEVVRVISSAVFASYMPQAIEAVSRTVGEELHLRAPATTSDAMQDLITKLWKAMLKLSTDAHPDVSLLAQETCDILFQCYAHSQQFFANETSLDQAICKLELASGQQSLLGSATSIGEALLGRPPSVSRHDSTSSIGPAGTRPINGSVPAHHRHTMHLSPGSLPHAPTPRTPSVAGSVHVNLADRFADMGNAQPADTTQKLSEIEQAWMDWGRKELRDQSSFLDWAGAHFTEFDISLFANVSGPLHDSKTLVESRERNRHVDRMETSSRVMSSQSSTMKWMDVRPVATIKEPATTAILHPLEPHAIVASSRGTVSVFDWEAHAQVGHYSIGAQDTSSDAQTIGNLHLINPLGQSKLLVSSRDGKVRIFASYAPDFKPSPSPLEQFPRPRLLTAFTAMPWSSHGSSFSVEGCEMVTAWNQRSGILFAGGNDKEVRIWDITAEMCIEEIAVASMGGVTCLSHDGMAGNIFAVGNANGSVRVMDRRLSARTGVVANWREHCPSKICNVSMLAGQAEVVSASENGDVKYWDLRNQKLLLSLANTHPDKKLEYMTVHENAPITMTASYSIVNFWNRGKDNIGVVTATEKRYSSLGLYMKALAGYSTKQSTLQLRAAALHTYLPMAIIVSNDGRISSIYPTITAT
ncbi:Target of rapamycin complex 1 subunit kog1 [Coemansia sp. RSA 2336]|nr:Target of rapamycin complex 1 subunit kog1 [Coemansia sp. RSA 2336]